MTDIRESNDLLSLAELVHQEAVERWQVGHGGVDEEVVVPGQNVNRADLRQGQREGPETLDNHRLSGRTWNAIERLDGEADLGQVDVGVESGERAAVAPATWSARDSWTRLSRCRAASSRLLSRAFACSSRMIAESTSSMPAPAAALLNDLRFIKPCG